MAPAHVAMDSLPFHGPDIHLPRRSTCLESSTYLTTEVLPVERQASDATRAFCLFSLLGIRPLSTTQPNVLLQPTPNGSSESRPCTQCRVRRKKCEVSTDFDDPRCLLCSRLRIPVPLCFRQTIVQYQPFLKWKNDIYEILFTAIENQGACQPIAEFRHYTKGPTLRVQCCEFKPTYKHQVRALKKDSSGWHSIPTTAYCVKDLRIDISSYVDNCIPFALDEICESTSPLSVFFRIARVYQDHPLIRDCIGLFTCLRLLFIGWQFHGCEVLGMAMVNDHQSPWHGHTPVPRMIQNQLGHLLELRIIELDRKILEALHKTLQTRKRSAWVFTTLAFLILLHVRELDAARNIFWRRYKDSGGFWIHPSKPSSLIEEEVASCNALLFHYHSVIGQMPMTMNWDTQKSRDLLENDEMAITAMKVLQSYISSLKRNRLIGRKASDMYQDGRPETVQFTVSSLIFEKMENGGMEDFFY